MKQEFRVSARVTFPVKYFCGSSVQILFLQVNETWKVNFQIEDLKMNAGQFFQAVAQLDIPRVLALNLILRDPVKIFHCADWENSPRDLKALA